MIPTVRIHRITDYGGVVVELDERTLGDLFESALRRAYGDGYEDGSQDNIKAD